MVHFDEEASEIWVTLKIPIGIETFKSKLYNISIYPVPAAKGASHATKIQQLAAFVVIKTDLHNRIFVAPIAAKSLKGCAYSGGHDTDYMCNFPLTIVDVSHESCLATVVSDNAKLIHRQCEFHFLMDHITSGFEAISGSEILVYHVDELLLECQGKESYKVKCCHYCIFSVPCNCEVYYRKTHSFASF